MTKHTNQMPIGIFDSGVGGVSVLKEALKILPNERFIYFADSINAPYGVKDYDDVACFSFNAAHFLIKQGIKALVVACNTATAVAIKRLRDELLIPVIGMEPAVKPAIELGKEGKILVMATPVTLRQEKFNQLLHRFDDERSKVMPLPCPGLVELIEQGKTEGIELKGYFDKLFKEVPKDEIAVVVLGCTHYVFVKEVIAEYFSPSIQVIDGNCGTAKHLKHVLAEEGLLNIGVKVNSDDRVEFYTSGDNDIVVPICERLLGD